MQLLDKGSEIHSEAIFDRYECARSECPSDQQQTCWFDRTGSEKIGEGSRGRSTVLPELSRARLHQISSESVRGHARRASAEYRDRRASDGRGSYNDHWMTGEDGHGKQLIFGTDRAHTMLSQLLLRRPSTSATCSTSSSIRKLRPSHGIRVGRTCEMQS